MKEIDKYVKLRVKLNIIFILINVAIVILGLVLSVLGWNVDYAIGYRVGGILCVCLGMFFTVTSSILLGATVIEIKQKYKVEED